MWQWILFIHECKGETVVQYDLITLLSRVIEIMEDANENKQNSH